MSLVSHHRKVKTMTVSPSVLAAENPWAPRPGDTKPKADPAETGNGQQNTWSAGFKPQGAGRRTGGGGNQQPPFINWFRQNGQTGSKIVLGLIVLVLLWLASGLYRVDPEQQAIITRFGRYIDTVEEQGLNYHLPWPVENAQKLNVTFERRLEIGFMGTSGERMDNPDESQMLTGDANIVDIDFVVQWKIDNAKDFIFNIRDPENTIKKVAESSMREVVGQNDLQDIITDRREDVASRVRNNMQSILDSYKAGVAVTQVLVQDASVPGPVLEAFEDVIRATQEAETNKNKSYKYRNEIVPRAQGDAIRLIKEAEAYKSQVVAQANGEAKRFNDVYTVYRGAPDVTRSRLYLQAIQDVLQNSRTIVTDGNGTSSPLSILNLNDLHKRADKRDTTDTQ